MKVTVSILDREYTINCPTGAEDTLRASVEELDAICQQIHAKTPSASADKILTIAAINLASQSVQMEAEMAELNEQIALLKSKLELIE